MCEKAIDTIRPCHSSDTFMLKYSIAQNPYQPTIVLVHGFALSEHIWDDLLSLLHRHYQVICLILPRTMNDLPDVEALEGHIAREIIRIVDDLGIDRFALMGHSMGGYLSLGVLSDYTSRISHFILLNSTCFADPQERKEKRQQIIEHLQNYGEKSFLNQAVPSWIGKTFKEKYPSKVLDIISESATLPKELLIYYQRYMIQRPDCSALIQNPTMTTKRLVIVGELDPLIADTDFDALQHISLAVLDDVAHMSMIEDPFSLEKTIVSFISA